jgi:hypothetical protein
VEVAVTTPDASTEKVTPKITKVAPKGKDPKKVEVKPEIKKVDPPKETPGKLDGNKVAAQYSAIGKKLAAMGQNADPNWWVLWRRIKINEAMGNPARLAETAKTLATIQSEMTARDKK